MRELYILLPALTYGNKSMEGKTQLSVNLGPSERELISPPAANYCHEIKCFVLFGECQPFHGKTKEGKRERKKKSIALSLLEFVCKTALSAPREKQAVLHRRGPNRSTC